MTTARQEQLEKLRACAWHLLDGQIELQARYAMLHPMLFDQAVIDRHGQGRRVHGFSIIRSDLYLSCCKDIANLALDSHKPSVSVYNVMRSLDSAHVQQALEDECVAAVNPLSDNQQLDAYYWSARRQERKDRFRRELSELQVKWRAFSTSQRLMAFNNIRKKLAAHKDISMRNGKYELLNIATLAIKWSDIALAIGELQSLVVLIGSVVRDASFSWVQFEQQVSRWSNDYWVD